MRALELVHGAEVSVPKHYDHTTHIKRWRGISWKPTFRLLSGNWPNHFTDKDYPASRLLRSGKTYIAEVYVVRPGYAVNFLEAMEELWELEIGMFGVRGLALVCEFACNILLPGMLHLPCERPGFLSSRFGYPRVPGVIAYERCCFKLSVRHINRKFGHGAAFVGLVPKEKRS